MNDIIRQLEKYIDLENDDFSNACNALIEMYSHRSVLSKMLKADLEREICENLKWYQDNTVIMTRTVKSVERQVQYLEMKEDIDDDPIGDIDDDPIVRPSTDGMLEHYQVPSDEDFCSFDDPISTEPSDEAKIDMSIEEVRQIMSEMNDAPELNILANKNHWTDFVEDLERRSNIMAAAEGVDGIGVPTTQIERFQEQMDRWKDKDNE